MDAAFLPFANGLLAIGKGMIVLGGGATVVSIASLALMNFWAVFDPRMGQGIKGGLMRVLLSGILLGLSGGGAAVFAALSGAQI